MVCVLVAPRPPPRLTRRRNSSKARADGEAASAAAAAAAAPDDDDDADDNEGPDADASAAFARAARLQAQAQPLRPATLYLVATPLGNLSDLSLRALSVLQGCDAILAEDTRRTRRLLSRHGVPSPPGRLQSYHAHNEKAREQGVLERLRGGETVALVSDAGTPGIADPGSALVASLVGGECGGGLSKTDTADSISVCPIPGPCAAIAALIASGLPTDRFTFVGFLPPKRMARRAELEEASSAAGAGTLIFYVSPHAAVATLSDCAEVLGASRRCALARELTKAHEEFLRGTLAEVGEELARRQAEGDPRGKGEMVLVVEGSRGRREVAKEALARALSGEGGGGDIGSGGGAEEAGSSSGGGSSVDVRARLADLLRQGEGAARASKQVAKELGVGRRPLYELAERIKRELEQEQEQQQDLG